MVKAVIIDDEINSRELLTTLLEKYCDGVNVAGSGTNVLEGINLINAVKPDLIFLDIEMPDGTGFDLLDTLSNANYLTCFTTGYDKYAIKAIEYGAFGYILKPIDIEALRKVISKAQNQLKVSTARPEDSQTIIINDQDNFWVLQYDEIINIESAGNYSLVYTVESKKLLCHNTLNQLEEGLESNNFFRCHRSHIVNLKYINSVENGRTGTAILTNDLVVPIANRRLKEFKKAISALK